MLDGSVGVVKYNGKDENVVIPSKLGGKTVWMVDFGAFTGCTSLKSVTIPDSVMQAGGIFRDCTSLESINVSEKNECFTSIDGVLYNKDETVLKSYPVAKVGTAYVIPNSVVTIDNSAFFSCKNLENVTIPDGVVDIMNYAFAGCEGLKSITIPESVTNIGRDAFALCTNLTEIRGKAGSAAETYANENNIKFVSE